MDRWQGFCGTELVGNVGKIRGIDAAAGASLSLGDMAGPGAAVVVDDDMAQFCAIGVAGNAVVDLLAGR